MIRTLLNLFVVLVCATALSACGKNNPMPTAPTPIPEPTPEPTPEPEPPALVSLTGTVRSNTGIALSAIITILDGVNAGKSTTTLNGAYKFDNLEVGNGNLSAKVAGYNEVRSGVYIDGTNTLNFTVGYDGRWLGQGSGTSSRSTTATMDIGITVSSGVITSLHSFWRINTVPGTVQSSYCGGEILWSNIPINGTSFSRVQEGLYDITVRGSFTSDRTVAGTATFVYKGSRPWCLDATINWTAVVRQ